MRGTKKWGWKNKNKEEEEDKENSNEIKRWSVVGDRPPNNNKERKFGQKQEVICHGMADHLIITRHTCGQV